MGYWYEKGAYDINMQDKNTLLPAWIVLFLYRDVNS